MFVVQVHGARNARVERMDRAKHLDRLIGVGDRRADERLRRLRAEAVEDNQGVVEGLSLFLQRVPGWANYYNVKLDPDGRPNASDVAEAARTRVIVRTRPA